MKTAKYTEQKFNYPEPWWPLSENKITKAGIQRELKAEIGPEHPLWSLQPKAFAKTGANDDILVQLNDKRYACVHLVWHGKIDMFPDKFPSFQIFESKIEVQQFLDEDAEGYV
jgi:hypothetical protein